MKKKVGAVVAGFVVQLSRLFVIHSVWLKQYYMASASLWRSQEDATSRVWAMLLSVLIYVIGAVWIYAHGVESKPWIGQGIRFGILLAMVTVVYGSLSGWVILPISPMLVLKWIVGESLLSLLFGVVVAAICQPRSATA
jgi:hypothetical protein